MCSIAYTLNSISPFFTSHPNSGQLPTTAQLIQIQPVTNLCRLFINDADYKVVKPFGEIYPDGIFQEYLDSNCWNQMDFVRRMGIAQ